jgi:hypothetical protein
MRQPQLLGVADFEEWFNDALIAFLTAGKVVPRGAASADESVLGTCKQARAGAMHAWSFNRTKPRWRHQRV